MRRENKTETMNKYKCVIIIKDIVEAESLEEAKEIMCNNAIIRKSNVTAEKGAAEHI